MKVSREMVFMNRRLFPFNGNITVMLENYISAKLSKEQYKVGLQLWCFKQFCLHLFHLQLVKVKLSLTGGQVISASEVQEYFATKLQHCFVHFGKTQPKRYFKRYFYTVKSIFASLLRSYNIVLSILAEHSLKGIGSKKRACWNIAASER